MSLVFARFCMPADNGQRETALRAVIDTHQGLASGALEVGRVPDLIIVDEAGRLKMAGLEQLRGLYDQNR